MRVIEGGSSGASDVYQGQALPCYGHWPRESRRGDHSTTVIRRVIARRPVVARAMRLPVDRFAEKRSFFPPLGS